MSAGVNNVVRPSPLQYEVADVEMKSRSFFRQVIAALARNTPAFCADVRPVGSPGELLSSLARGTPAFSRSSPVASRWPSASTDEPPERSAIARAEDPTASLDRDDPLKFVEILGSIDPSTRRRLACASTQVSYFKGQPLFIEGQIDESLIVLMSGAAVVFRTGPTGQRQVLTVVRRLDSLGELSLLDARPRSASAEALEDCEVLVLSRATFLEQLNTDVAAVESVMRSVGALVRRLTERQTATALVQIASSTSPTTTELNPAQLAEMAGRSQLSVNEAVGTFAARGWLHPKGDRLVLTDLSALRQRASTPDNPLHFADAIPSQPQNE